MNKFKVFFFSFFLFFTITACDKENENESIPDASYFACIWDKAPFSAFTDLVEYKGKYYCCFREGAAHVPTSSKEYGKIRILSSIDGINWVSIACLESDEFDFRDPKLVVTPNNKLMLYYGCASFINEKYVFIKTMVSFASNFMLKSQLDFNTSYSVSIEQDPLLSTYFLWRVLWKKNKAYGIAYRGAKIPVLVESSDGINYNIVSYLNIAPDSNEAGIQFLANGDIVIIIRTNGANGYIGTASPPYKEWEFEVLDKWIHSPTIININDNLFVAGRAQWGTSLFYLHGKSLKELYTYPAGGDYGYPGLLHVNNELWISYYASNTIFFTKISLSDVLKKVEIN